MSAEAKPERDPKTDPIAGDVLRDENSMRTVTKVAQHAKLGLRIYARIEWKSSHWKTSMASHYPEDWRKWAAGATVIRTGDEEKT